MGTGSGLPTQALARSPLPKPPPHVLSSRASPSLHVSPHPGHPPPHLHPSPHLHTHAHMHACTHPHTRTHPRPHPPPRTLAPPHPPPPAPLRGVAGGRVRCGVGPNRGRELGRVSEGACSYDICMRRCTSCMRARTHAHTHPLRLFRRSTNSTRCSPPPPLAAPPARNGTCMAYAWPMAHAWHMHGNALGRHRHRAQPRSPDAARTGAPTPGAGSAPHELALRVRSPRAR